MSDQFPEADTMNSKRPVFITVLCILTFVGSGWGIISAGAGLAMSGFSKSIYEKTTAGIDTLQGSSAEGRAIIEEQRKMIGMPNFENAKKQHYMNLGGSALCLLGALFMFRLKKSGFIPYVAGCGLTVAGYFLFPSITEGTFSFLSQVGGFFWLFICGAFCIMYGLNLKYMK